MFVVIDIRHSWRESIGDDGDHDKDGEEEYEHCRHDQLDVLHNENLVQPSFPPISFQFRRPEGVVL